MQIVGDGTGRVVTLGDRDCSTQRRNQKVLEEAPAPGLPDALRARMLDAAEQLAAVGRRTARRARSSSSSTCATDTLAFLEVNARLQVEHTVTEAVWGIDLVEWMIRIAAGDASVLDERPAPRGHAIEARVCAENPWRGHEPSAGTLTIVSFPDDARVDTWVETGTDVTANYDSLLAKVIAHGATRAEALDRLRAALDGDAHRRRHHERRSPARGRRRSPDFTEARLSTSLLGERRARRPRDRGAHRRHAHHGAGPSGPARLLGGRRAAERPDGRPLVPDRESVVGNAEGDRRARAHRATGRACCSTPRATICLAGAPTRRRRRRRARSPMWEPVDVAAGATLTVGAIGPPGVRAYLLVRGGIDVAPVLGSASTFTLGGFGGSRGTRVANRRRAAPRRRRVAASGAGEHAGGTLPDDHRRWEIAVLVGPHGDQEFLTAADIDRVLRHRLARPPQLRAHRCAAGRPEPEWARADGGDAGLHPSNIHDTAYSVGSIDFTGDMPIILGPDGPSLGGFVCPAVVSAGDRWKLGPAPARGDRCASFP